MIADAKTRKRRPNGKIITPEEEAEEIRLAEVAQVAKAKLWADRDAQMNSAF